MKRTSIGSLVVGLGAAVISLCLVAPAALGLVRLDGSATVFTGGDATFGSWAGGPPANIQDGLWESPGTMRGYSWTATPDYIGYAWSTPQHVSNILLVNGSAQYEPADPFDLQWSPGGGGTPDTWTWYTLATYTNGVSTPHLLVDLPSVRGIRILENKTSAAYFQLGELAVYSGGRLMQSVIPVEEASFSTALSTNPGGFSVFQPSRLVDPDITREFWARYQPGGALAEGGPEVTWKGSWSSPQYLGGIVLWGGEWATGTAYYPSSVDSFKLYTLKPGASPSSTDYVNDWILQSQSATALTNGLGVEILFPTFVSTEAVALLQTGNDPGTGSGFENFSMYGGHMALLVAAIPEPSVVALFALGLGLTWLRRRR